MDIEVVIKAFTWLRKDVETPVSRFSDFVICVFSVLKWLLILQLLLLPVALFMLHGQEAVSYIWWRLALKYFKTISFQLPADQTCTYVLLNLL